MRRQGCRLGLALSVAACSSLLLLQHCRLSAYLPNDEDDYSAPGGKQPQVLTDSASFFSPEYVSNLHLQITGLNEEILLLHYKLKDKHKKDEKISEMSKSRSRSLVPSSSQKGSRYTKTHNGSCSDFLHKKAKQTLELGGISLNNEYEVIPFSHFTWSRIYPSELGLGKRVVEKPIGFRRKDLMSAITAALRQLNSEMLNGFSIDDFIEGEYRTVPSSGTQYELLFRERRTNQSVQYRRLRLIRPFAPLTVVKSEQRNTKQLVNIVLPLAGRLDTFKGFMEKLLKVIIRHDRKIFLTVVYFGSEGLQDVRNIITKSSKLSNFRHIKLLTLNETFSRGKALQVGAMHWSKGDVLLFMCDVDVAFSTRFLERCRLHASPGASVYYPIVFSLYNPNLVYSLLGKPVPQELDQLVISRDTGFWRDFGYGMTCQYRSDFLSVQGFDENIVGWGGEDVLLYRKYVRSSLTIVRATDPGIFHLWHPKNCSTTLTVDQYRACLTSRALNEASHAQLGLVAFKEDLDKHPMMSDNINRNSNKTIATKDSVKKDNLKGEM